jgi:hypothetical protein
VKAKSLLERDVSNSETQELGMKDKNGAELKPGDEVVIRGRVVRPMNLDPKTFVEGDEIIISTGPHNLPADPGYQQVITVHHGTLLEKVV